MDEKPQRSMMPVAVFIGMLLLFNGLTDAFRNIYNVFRFIDGLPYLRQFLLSVQMPPTLSIGFLISLEVLPLLLSLGGIIAGLGLWRLATWARRTSLIVVGSYTLYWLLSPVLTSVITRVIFHPLYQNALQRHPFSAILRPCLTSVPHLLFYTALAVFLASRPMHQLLETTTHPGRLAHLAESLRNRLPQEASPLLQLIGILLIFWGVNMNLAYLYNPQLLGDQWRNMMTDPAIFREVGSALLHAVEIIAGIGVIRQRRWAMFLAGVVLIGICALTLLPMLDSSTWYSVYQPLKSIILQQLFAVLSLPILVIVIAILLRNGRLPWAPQWEGDDTPDVEDNV